MKFRPRIGPWAGNRKVSERAPLDVRLASIRYSAEGINLFELTASDGGPLPDVASGATLRLEIPNGTKRTYFIADRSSLGGYVVGVRRDPDGLGSKYLHDKVKVGKQMRAVVAAGDSIDFGAKRTVFVAEDIGVFHAWPLLRALANRGLAWELHYDAWSRTDAALLDELHEFGDRVRIHVRSERRGASLDWDTIAAGLDRETSVYATISEASRDAMTAAFARRMLDIGDRVRWTNVFEPPSRGPVAFDVVLARSNLTLPVHEDESILAVVRAAGVDAPFFCAAGICGRCRTTVLEGEPRHLDAVLKPAERASNHVMMICRSRSTGGRLVLDL